jgi:hypothetical protein
VDHTCAIVDVYLYCYVAAGVGTMNKPDAQFMRVPVHVLGSVHPRPGTGWEWNCNFQDCKGHGFRIDRTAGFRAIALHWRERHRSYEER